MGTVAPKRIAIPWSWPIVGVGDAVMKVGAVIPEADARWMRLICIAVSECWPMYQREAGVFIPYRGSSLPRFSGCLRETIHPHTCIRNGIIYLPPWALITQPQHLDGPQSCTRGPGCRKEWVGEVLMRYSRAAGQTGKFTVPEWVEDKKKKKDRKEINGAGTGDPSL